MHDHASLRGPQWVYFHNTMMSVQGIRDTGVANVDSVMSYQLHVGNVLFMFLHLLTLGKH